LLWSERRFVCSLRPPAHSKQGFAMGPWRCFEETKGARYTNEVVNSDPTFAGDPPNPNEDIHVLICGLDYKNTRAPLTCTMDAQNILNLCRACGVMDIVLMLDNQCTKENVKQQIEAIGNRCKENDYFVFFFAGHGMEVADQDGDEDDGQDEAMVLVDRYGQIPRHAWMTDDEFSECLTQSIPQETQLLLLVDCCHSATIGDLSKDIWDDFSCVSICGCKDNQTSGDMGKGGIFTHSLLMAIDNLQKKTEDDYSVGKAYNVCLQFDNTVFRSAQDITLQTTSSVTPGGMAWPLIPQYTYISPMNMARTGRRALDDAPPSAEELAQIGISSHINEIMDHEASLDLDPDAIEEPGTRHSCSVQ